MSKLPASNPYFIVRNSPIHGRGVFAARDIRKGTRITEYVGERITHAEADRRHEDKADDDNHTFLFTVNSRTVIDGGNGGNDARWINHSCDPNCESVIERNRVFVEAVKAIAAGEELTYDYMIERDPDDPPGMDEVFGCRCGTAKCRGTMLVDWEKPASKRKSAVKKQSAVKKKSAARKKSAGKSKVVAGKRSTGKPQAKVKKSSAAGKRKAPRKAGPARTPVTLKKKSAAKRARQR